MTGVLVVLKNLGGKHDEPVGKWKIQKKDLPAEDTHVVLLTIE